MRVCRTTYLSLFLPTLSTPTLPSTTQPESRELLEQFIPILQQYTPIVGIEPSYGDLLLDLTGTKRLHGSLPEICSEISKLFAKLKIPLRIGSAPTIGAAWALARFETSMPAHLHPEWYDVAIEQEGLEAQILSRLGNLPLRMLRIPEETTVLLRQFGVSNIQKLFELPRPTLVQRFGNSLLLRIQQLTGERSEPPEAFALAEKIFWFREFFTPLVTIELIKKVLQGGFTELFSRLHARGLQSGYFSLSFEYPDQNFKRRRLTKIVSLNAASEEVALIAAILEPLLEKLSFPHGVTAIHLEAMTSEPIEAHQGSLNPSPSTVEPRILDSLINTITAQLGRKHLHQVGFAESHIPEHSFFYPEVGEKFRVSLCAENLTSYGYSEFFDRPSKILHAPEEMNVVAMLPDCPPSWFQWHGENLRVLRGEGPERISPEWWKETADADRDYFKIQDSTGRWLWVYRDNASHRWFLQGIWG